MDKIGENNHLNKYFMAAVFTVLLLISLFIIQGFILSIFVGAVIAYAIYPAYAWLIKKTKSERESALILSMSAVIVIFVLGLIIMPQVVKEGGNVYNFYKEKIPEKPVEFANCSNASNDVVCVISNYVFKSFDKETINSQIESVGKPASIDFFKNLPGIILQVTIIIFSAAYFLHNAKNLVQQAVEKMPLKESNKKKAVTRIDEVMKAVIFGNIITAFIEGLVVLAIFLVLGVPLAFIAGLLTMFFALIPPLGAMIVWGPAVVVLFLLNEYLKAALLLIFCLGILGFIDNLGRPMIIGSKCRISPFWILLGVLGGLAMFGFAGIIIGPLVLSLFVTSWDILADEMNERHEDNQKTP